SPTASAPSPSATRRSSASARSRSPSRRRSPSSSSTKARAISPRSPTPAAPVLAGRLPGTTLRQVLSHTAGIRHYRPDRRDNSPEFKTTAQALDLFLGDSRLSEPGTKYSYSTHGYTVAVAALEHATGQPFVDLVRRRVRDRVATRLDCEVLAEPKS